MHGPGRSKGSSFMVTMQPSRAFLALPLPLPVRMQLKQIMRELASQDGDRRVRWLHEENLHLILRHFGDAPSALLQAIGEDLMLRLAGRSGFQLHFTNLTVFPGPRQPRVLVAQAEPVPELLTLARLTEAVAVAHGLAAEERPYRPHVILARMTTPRVPRWSLPSTLQGGDFFVHRCALYQNEPWSQAQRYRILRDFDFR